MVRLALRSALSDRASEGRVLVVDWGFEVPKTSAAVAALAALGVTGRALVVLDAEDQAVWKSFRNLGHVHLCDVRELNAYDVLCSDWVIFTEATLPSSTPNPTRPVTGDDDAVGTPVTVGAEGSAVVVDEAEPDDETLIDDEALVEETTVSGRDEKGDPE
jgi:hypothetical protein